MQQIKKSLCLLILLLTTSTQIGAEMKICAGTMKFEMQADWRDTSVYEYRSPDGNAYITIKMEVMDKPFALDALMNFRIDLLKRGLSQAAATPIQHRKLGKFEARQADISFLDGDDHPVIMRVIVGQPSPVVSVSINCRANKLRWPDTEKIVNGLAASFAFEGDKLIRE
jgi:hypothetical protein